MDPAAVTNITDINFDCLEVIFKHLSLSDLLNIADANKFLGITAAQAYIDRFGMKNVVLGEFASKQALKIDTRDSVKISSWKQSFQFLRCFGYLTKKLNISLDRTAKYLYNVEYPIFFQHLINYTNEYCSQSLTELVIKGNLDRALNDLKAPFLFVEKIHVDGMFEKNVLTRLFPKLQILAYNDCRHKSFEFESYFPCLKYMKLLSFALSKNQCAQMCSFLQLNPQLKSLTLPFISGEQLEEIISNKLPHLKHLTILDPLLNIPQIGWIIRKRCSTPPISSNQLERHEPSKRKSFTMRKLTVVDSWFATWIFENSSKLAEILPFLGEIRILSERCDRRHYTLDEISKFVNQFTCMQKFTCVFHDGSSFDAFVNRFSDEWECSATTIKIKWR